MFDTKTIDCSRTPCLSQIIDDFLSNAFSNLFFHVALNYFSANSFIFIYTGCDEYENEKKVSFKRQKHTHIIVNTPSEKGTVNYAKETLPTDLLELKESSIHGLGVFAKCSLGRSATVRFGPYEGKKVHLSDAQEMYMNSYLFEVSLSSI